MLPSDSLVSVSPTPSELLLLLRRAFVRCAVTETGIAAMISAPVESEAGCSDGGRRRLVLVISLSDWAEPLVRQSLVKCDALFRSLDEQAEDQVLAVLRVAGPLWRVKDDPILTGHPYRLLP